MITAHQLLKSGLNDMNSVVNFTELLGYDLNIMYAFYLPANVKP